MKEFQKLCVVCKQSKPRECYNKATRSPDGLQPQCRSCQADYYATNRTHVIGLIQARKKARRKENIAYIDAYLAKHPCVDCGESDPIVLEFDHVRGVKLGNVSTMSRRNIVSLATIEAEIAKCEVRCANCHRRVTHRRRIENQTPVTPLPSKQEKG